MNKWMIAVLVFFLVVHTSKIEAQRHVGKLFPSNAKGSIFKRETASPESNHVNRKTKTVKNRVESDWKELLDMTDLPSIKMGSMTLNQSNTVQHKTNFLGDSFSSNLPLVFIESVYQPVKDSMVTATIKIIDHGGMARNNTDDSVYSYNGNTKIKLHGNASLTSPQLSYSLELSDSTWNDTSVSLMGLPRESDWLLINTWNDRSFIRNPLMYTLFGSMGHYAPRYHFCEVFFNQEYIGLYILTEKVKRDSARINISKLKKTDLAGDSLTGGYIFKHDYVTDTLGWLSDIGPSGCSSNRARFQYEYPNYNSIQPEQATYIRSFVDSVEATFYSSHVYDSTTGYRKYIDVNSFADFLICHEFSWNGDGFAKSMYFYKDRDSISNKLFTGPVWDFDWALKKMPWTASNIPDWNYDTYPCNNLQATLPWHAVMMKDAYFRNTVRCRWENYRTNILTMSGISHFIDSMEAYLQEASERHYSRWPTWGLSLGTPEQEPYALNMQQETDTLKAMISRRMAWIDTHLPGVCGGSNENGESTKSVVTYYPNPASDQVNIQAEDNIITVGLYDFAGRRLREWIGENAQLQVNVKDVNRGIYILRTQTETGVYSGRIILE